MALQTFTPVDGYEGKHVGEGGVSRAVGNPKTIHINRENIRIIICRETSRSQIVVTSKPRQQPIIRHIFVKEISAKESFRIFPPERNSDILVTSRHPPWVN